MKKYTNKKSNKKKKWIFFLIIVILIVLGIVIYNLNKQPQEELKYIKKATNDYTEQGDFQLEKSATWISSNYVELRLDYESILKASKDNLDIILVIDSFDEEQQEEIKENVNSFVQTVLSNPSNRISIVSTKSNDILSSAFTNNEDKVEEFIKKLELNDKINSEKLLNKSSELLESTNSGDYSNCLLLILSNEISKLDSNKQIKKYQEFKDKYPLLPIAVISYDLEGFSSKINEFSTEHHTSNNDTLKRVLLDSSVESAFFEEVEIIEKINTKYFSIDSEEDIIVSTGDVEIKENDDEQKIVWTMDKEILSTGEPASLTVDLSLNEKYRDKEKIIYIKTDKGEKVTTKLSDERERTLKNKKSIVLKNKYTVSYDMKVPSTCNLSRKIDDVNYFYNELVEIETRLPNCGGYQFKGWEIKGEALSDLSNRDSFRMPSSDVEIVAKWEAY